MNNFDKIISEKVKSYLDKNVEFTTEESEKIQIKIQQGIQKSRKSNRFYWTALASVAAIFLILSLSFLNGPLLDPENEQAVQSSDSKGEELSVDLSDIPHMNIGAEMPRLLYADDKIAVIHGTFGVIVYNMHDSMVTNRISYEHLKPYDISMMAAAVSQDGTTIFIGNDNMSFTDDIPFTHQYNISTRIIKENSEQPSEFFMPINIKPPGINEEYDKYFELQYLMDNKIVEVDNSFIYLRSIDWNMKNLQIVFCQYEDGESIVFDVFKLRESDAEVSTKEHALVKAIEYHNNSTEVKSDFDFPTTIKSEETVSIDIEVGGPKGNTTQLYMTVNVENKDGSYIVTLTEDYNVTVSGTNVISYWRYEVANDKVKLLDKKEKGNLVKIIK
ncbi:MAG: hypothetical protein ACK4M9_05450 [Anaerobacillus sp.]|uniref:hypothetical protein n=1 Tax=Anaerobacillus sp. TaxID=1872506 RepID=UPI00391CBA07